ncbi:Phosphatidylinositol-binding clathrin assembly protein unc-11 [Pichia kudriavzevii]|uniref:Phosphatidylinositol-binding clathrin assembly protein unc-11 n=1 Tax=Pichia kudriavzevii TaxID=4909 RepID=A0A1V2LHH5_PICKU|nr:Phosphatidylinositol-binding clathrin assembly protein unc-11 [Pichia kudriavzevii]
MTTLEKLVEGATKIKLAPPKPKYIEPILMTTTEGERSDDFRTVMKALNRRLGDSAWTIVYKALIVIHILVREGDENVCIKYLSNHLSIFDLKIGKGGKFISNGGDLNQVYSYAQYLTARAKAFGMTKHDFIKETKKPFGSWNSSDKSSILRDISVDKGLLRLTESVQAQIDALLRCKFRESEVNNDLVVLSFRMLTTDLISLYQCLNEGVLNILEHFFDLSKTDAERAFEIYEHFTKQTKKVIDFLKVAKHLEGTTKLRVPTIKHAQTSLTDSLRDYLNDPDFEINRRQYLAEKNYSKNQNDISTHTIKSHTNPFKIDEPIIETPKQQAQQFVPQVTAGGLENYNVE